MGAVYKSRRKAGETPDAIYNSSSEILRRKFKHEYDADKDTERSNEAYGAQRVAAATLGNERALARDNAEAALAPKAQSPDVSREVEAAPTDSSGQPTKRRAKFNTSQALQSVSI